MTNIEKLIKKYGIEIVKRIPEEQGHLSHVIAYGVQISMYELIEHLKMSEYIASYKHLIGCEVYDYDYGSFTIFSVSKNNNGGLFFNGNENEPFDSLVSFYLDNETHVNDSATLGTYKEYMQLHYPEHVHVWSQQL